MHYDYLSNMNPTLTVHYLGDLRCRGTHISSGQTVATDAPTDNNGKGESFSPTDLLCTSLATCMLPLMGITAEKKGLAFTDARCSVIKVMASEPRRVTAVKIAMTITGDLSERDKTVLENAAKTCPVARSLHPDIEQDVTFTYA